MSLLYSFIISAAMLLSVSSIPYSKIETAFESSDASAIVELGKDKILMNIDGKEGAYGHSQAKLVLKDFFDKNPPSSFTFSFKGKDTGEGTFAIGSYVSRTGKYRVTIHFKKINSDFAIESLAIEKD